MTPKTSGKRFCTCHILGSVHGHQKDRNIHVVIPELPGKTEMARYMHKKSFEAFKFDIKQIHGPRLAQGLVEVKRYTRLPVNICLLFQCPDIVPACVWCIEPWPQMWKRCAWQGEERWFSVQFSRSIISHSSQPRESQHARPPCPSPTPGVYSNHVHQGGDAIQPSHPLSSSPALNPSQHHGLFQWVNSLHEVARVLEFQLQHQSFQWTPRTDLL